MTEGPSLRVLLVGEAPLLARLQSALARGEGRFEIASAPTVPAALPRLQRGEAEAVLLPLEEGEGVRAVAEAAPRAAIVVLNASGRRRLREALEAGAQDEVPLDELETTAGRALHLAVERKRIELWRRAQADVAAVLAGAAGVQAAVPDLLAVLATATGWEFAAVWLPEGGRLRCAATWQDPQRPQPAFAAATRASSFAFGEGLPGRVHQHGEPVWIEDVLVEPGFHRVQAAREAGLRSAVAFAVGPPGNVQAVLEFLHPAPQGPDAHLLANMQALTRHLFQFWERRKAEEALRASEARKAAVLEGALDAVIAMDADGLVVDWNPAAERMFGFPRREAMGRLLADLIIPERHREAHRRGLERFRASGRGTILGRRLEFEAVHADGREIPVELTVTAAPSGSPAWFVGWIRDLTERKEAERTLEEIRERIAIADRLTALGTLVSGVAHEIRTPLTYTGTHLYLLRARLEQAQREGQLPAEAGKELQDHLAASLDGVDRINALVADLRVFSRTPRGVRERVALDGLVAAAVELFRVTQRGRVQVEAALASGAEVEVAGDQIQRVVLNLLSNAAEAQGTRTVRVSSRREGASVVLAVEDDGAGIPSEVQSRMFDLFFTTKPEGTGLGLSLSRRIVDNHQGEMRWSSQAGRGTRFEVILPAAGGSASLVPEEGSLPSGTPDPV